MGNSVVPFGGQASYLLSGVRKLKETYNTRVAIWQLPYKEDYLKYDDDGNKWYESVNQWGDDEISQAEQGLKMSLERYKVNSKTIKYNDDTYDVISTYPNKTTVKEKHGENHVWIWIRNKLNQLVAEKIFNRSSNVGRKTLYQNVRQGDNTFTVVRVYSYDTTKNRATDVVNYGYTSNENAFIKGCNLETEYYALNGKEVKAEKTDNGEYRVIGKDGKILTFLVE